MVGVTWGTGLTRRLAFGVAVIAALAFLAAAQNGRAPAQQAPSSSPSAVPDASQVPAASTHGQHTVTITFDYDFGRTPGCSKKVKTLCVQQFVAYDISAGARQATMLFPIPLPPNPVGVVRGITATSPKLDFESGKHLLSVAAEGPDGRQSRKSVCTTWVTIP